MATAGLTATQLKVVPREQLLEALVSHPKPMERPVLVRGTKAALGRPTADVALDIL